MYRLVVKHKVRATFRALTEGRPEVLLNQFASQFRYEFVGDHALGGQRTTRAAMQAWFERLGRLFPGLEFRPLSIEVGGMPWATTVLTEVELRGTAAGKPYENVMFQRIELSFGKIRSIRTLEDTQHLTDVLADAVAAGVDEAKAAPITD